MLNFGLHLLFFLLLEVFLKLSGVSSDYRVLSSSIYGYTDVERKEAVISSVLMDNQNGIRFARSTIAHEVGHAILHVKQYADKKLGLCFSNNDESNSLMLYRQKEIPRYCNPEWQAWRFAGALMLPECIFKKMIERRICDKELSDIFHINQAFVKTRRRIFEPK